MSKVILLLLLISLFVVINPGLRDAAKPHLAFALDPLYEWQVRARVADMQGTLQRAVDTEQPIPKPFKFSQYLEDQYGEGGDLDPWGVPYYMDGNRHRIRVGSAGRDRTRNTDDDIRSEYVNLKR